MSPGEGQNPWLATPLPIRQCRYAYAEYARKFLKTPRFFIGVQRRIFRDQDPVNIAAAELVGLLHDQLAETGHGGHDLERFLVRIVFCLFADSTGIFEPRDVFVELIETRTSEDGADLGPWLAQLFQMLDTPEGQRPTTLDEDHQRRSIQRTSVHGLLRKDSRRRGGNWSGSKPGWAASPLKPNRIDPDRETTTLQARAPGKGWSQGTGHPQFKSA